MFWNKKQLDKRDLKAPKQADIRKCIVDLQLPQIILQLFDGNLCGDIANLHFLLDRYKAPYMFIDHSVEELNHYNVERYIPFLSIYQSTVFAYDKDTNRFVSYSIECFREDELERLTWDGLFIDEVCAWWEEEWPDDDIIHAGDLLGLQHTKELIEEITLFGKKHKEYSYQDFTAKKFDWIKSLKVRYSGSVDS